MPEFSFKDYGDINVTVQRMKKELIWLLNCLDSLNVKEINTNITRVKSKDGVTVINGPLIEMTDTNILRLKMGYDESTNKFVFTMIDKNGSPTVNLNSDGQLQLCGKPLIEMYDQSNHLRLRMGYDSATSKFVFQMYDILGVETISLNSTGEAVFKGNIETTKNAKVGNNIEIGDVSQSNVEKKISFFSNGAEQCSVEMDNTGKMKVAGYAGLDITSFLGDIVINSLEALSLSGYNNFSLETVNTGSTENANISHTGSGDFYLGHAGSGKVRPVGEWDCVGSSFVNLNNGTYNYVTTAVLNSAISGLQSQINALNARVTALENP